MAFPTLNCSILATQLPKSKSLPTTTTSGQHGGLFKRRPRWQNRLCKQKQKKNQNPCPRKRDSERKKETRRPTAGKRGWGIGVGGGLRAVRGVDGRLGREHPRPNPPTPPPAPRAEREREREEKNTSWSFSQTSKNFPQTPKIPARIPYSTRNS